MKTRRVPTTTGLICRFSAETAEIRIRRRQKSSHPKIRGECSDKIDPFLLGFFCSHKQMGRLMSAVVYSVEET